MLDFDLEFVEMKFKGEKHLIKRPSNKDVKDYSSKIKDAETPEEKEVVLCNFLASLGLKAEVYEDLTPSQLKKITEALYDSSKN